MKRCCTTCKFCLLADSGYSNYTVLETMVHCLRKLNPKLPAEDSYGNEDHAVNKFAETCDSYVAAKPLHLDVDGEDSWNVVNEVLADPALLACAGDGYLNYIADVFVGKPETYLSSTDVVNWLTDSDARS